MPANSSDTNDEMNKKAADTSSYVLEDNDDDDTEVFPEIDVADQEQRKRYKIQNIKANMLRTNINGIMEFIIITEPRIKSFYEMKMKLLNTSWITFTNNHEEILSNATEEELGNKYFGEKTYETLQQEYEFANIHLQDQLESISKEGTDNTHSRIKLPRIEIAHFYGNCKQWPSFQNLFTKMIHCNKELSSEEKIHYLLSVIRGDAAKLISHLTVSKQNYSTAWNILLSRYEDKRLITNTFIDTIMELPVIQIESANHLRTLHDTVIECLHALKNQGINTDSWDAILINILTRKLDRETHRLYETSLKNPKDIQTVKDFLNFLQLRFQSLGVLSRENVNKKRDQQSTAVRKAANVIVAKKHAKCSYCYEEHNLPECKKFQNLPHTERTKAIYYQPLCRRCLLPRHKNPCFKSCDLCKGAHHSLLHCNDNPKGAGKSQPPTQPAIQSGHTWNRNCILLGTAMVKASSNTSEELLRVLIDPGSQATFITEEASDKLKLTKFNAHADIIGMGQTEAGTASSVVELTISPRFTSNFNIKIKALVFKTLTRDMPEQHLDPWKWKHTKNILWAVPHPWSN